MWWTSSAAVLAISAIASRAHAAEQARLVGRYLISKVEDIPVPVHPGYSFLLPELPGQLVITAFEATPFIGKTAVYLHDLEKCEGDCLHKLPGSEHIDWPNAASGLSSSVFGFPAVVVGNGFVVPSHTTGGVWVLEASAKPEHLAKPVKITKDKADKGVPDSGWFYHLAVPLDMDGDGRLDLVTARSQYGVWPWNKKRGELLWLQQPDKEPLSGAPWAEHHLTDGPDFLFCVQPGSSTLALAAAEYLAERTVFYYMRDGAMQSRVLDEKSGPGFSCSWADLNGDGRLELLATNHLNKNGSVFAYAFDGDDFSTAQVSRHVLASGFSAVSTATGNAAPGEASAFHPNQNQGGKPYIFVSGDNGNAIFVLVPKSENPDNWSYTRQKIADLYADVGRISIGDSNGDGFADVFVPAYDSNKLLHYAFSTFNVDLAAWNSTIVV